MISRLLVAAITLAATTAGAQPFKHTYPNEFSDREAMLESLRQRAELVLPWMTTDTGRALVEATETLPPRIRRWRWSTVTYDERTYTDEDFEGLTIPQRQQLRYVGLHERIYYGGWATDGPFLEFRAFDVAVTGTPFAEPEALAGARVLLVEPGVSTHAWTLARLGAHVTIVSSSQRFRAVYNAPSDRGDVRGINGAPDGSVTIIDADFPADDSILIGGPFDLIIGINTLNRGTVDPVAHHMRSAPPNPITKELGGTPAEAAERFARVLAPGGRLVFYNWGLPAQPNATANARGDVRQMIEPEDAAAAGLTPVAFASDASVFNRLLGLRENAPEIRRPVTAEGLDAPQIAVRYAVYEKPQTP